MTGKVKEEAISWIKTIILAIIIALFINSVVIVNANVPTGSMENTIMAGDRLIASRLSYVFGEPERGDIVIFKYPDDPTGKTRYVKRIIGMPGETVEIKYGDVYIDGEILVENYIRETTEGNFGPYEVPEDSYFMMGDNRNNSLDARFWENTYIQEDDMLGKVIFRYYKKPSLIK